MTFSLRHIFLLTGIAIAILSFLFFGRDTGTYNILILLGLVVAGISYLIVLFKKDTLKSKFIWTVIVFASVGLQRLTESFLITKSYSIFLSKRKDQLTKLNNIILTKSGDVFYVPNSEKSPLNGFSVEELNEVYFLLQGTNISLIQKDSQRIFYRTFGMLDVSHGIYFFYATSKPDNRYKHISGNWYY